MNVSLQEETLFEAHFEKCEDVIEISISYDGLSLFANTSTPIKNVKYEWTINDIVVSNDSVIYNPFNGDYTVSATFDSCKIESSTFTINQSLYTIHAYPNPALNEVSLQFFIPAVSNMDVVLVNSLGQFIWKDEKHNFVGQYNERLNVSDLARGVYYILVTFSDFQYYQKVILI